MTRADLRDLIQAYGYGADTTDAQNLFLNQVYRNVLASRRWSFLQRRVVLSAGLAAGAGGVDLTQISDLRDVDAVRVAGQDADPQPIALQDLRALPFDTAASCPLYWSRAADQIEVWPTADRAYDIVVDYIYDPPLLADDSDVPVLPSAHHDVLAFGAVVALARRERDVNTQQLAAGDYAVALQRLRAADGIGQRQAADSVARSGLYSSFGPYGDGLILT